MNADTGRLPRIERLRRWPLSRWPELLGLALLVLSLPLIQRYRAGQATGERYGLEARYFVGPSFAGKLLEKRVEPELDLERSRSSHARSAGSIEWNGTVVFPRKGKFVFATLSTGRSSVEIDEQMLVHNLGATPDKPVFGDRIFEAGAHAMRVRFVGPGPKAQLRVVWTPARRWGGLEPVPATLLFPRSPKGAPPLPAFAIPPRDAPAAFLLCASWLFGALLLLRRPLGRLATLLRRERWARHDLAAFVALVGAALALRLFELDGAGQTWDEDVYWAAARNAIQNLLAGDFRAASWATNPEHPATAKWVYSAATLASESLTPGRAVSALLGALTCGFLFLAGRDLVSRGAGLLAGGLAAVLPHLVAHGKVMGLETPSGFFYLLTVWCFYRGLRREGNQAAYLWAGLFAGLATATRLVNGGVFFVLGGLYLVRHARTIWRERFFPLPVTLGVLPCVALAVFFGLWPYLWQETRAHLGGLFSFWKPDVLHEVFLGQRQPAPDYYYPLYFVVTTPVALLAGLPLYLGRLAVRRDLGHLVPLLWFAGPFLVALSPVVRDGVRYLYPALVPACLLVAAGFEGLVLALLRGAERARWRVPATAVLGTTLGLYTLHAALTVHPYYLDYYNEAVGGPARVAEKRWFELGWWGEGIEEAHRYVARYALPGQRVFVNAEPSHVLKVRDDLVPVRDPEADWVIYNQLFNDAPFRSPLHRQAYVVRAAGAPLVWVYRKRERPAAPPIRTKAAAPPAKRPHP
ncbi:MAG: glycosyltransferase family 39 protein [Deltaproteobacteria bacterium]|nr:glycosyltransferase family 39 protein [Deltaproteobacteria bacterium]